MTYDDLVALLARQTGLHSAVVKRVLVRLPEALLELPIGDTVRTPLGVFRMSRRKPRPILLPDGETTAEVAEQVVVKLKPGSKMHLVGAEETQARPTVPKKTG